MDLEHRGPALSRAIPDRGSYHAANTWGALSQAFTPTILRPAINRWVMTQARQAGHPGSKLVPLCSLLSTSRPEWAETIRTESDYSTEIGSACAIPRLPTTKRCRYGGIEAGCKTLIGTAQRPAFFLTSRCQRSSSPCAGLPAQWRFEDYWEAPRSLNLIYMSAHDDRRLMCL